jgi:murein DD-endopeptidase MepM/ murein hydrolase activator NlpD
VTPPPSSGQIIAASPPPTEAEITAAGRGRFVWPLQGDTISDFGVKGTGQRNDGVNIRAPQGTPVRAAAAGEVVYAGNQVPGFGNLVLVKHADGWVTAYAHLSTTEVKMRQQVAQGATLGAVGQTGGVPEPQLHFEVRYAPTPKDKARPVDPGLVLPR